MSQEHLPLGPNVFEILLSLTRGPSHGYTIISDIRERTRGDVVIGASTLYATMKRMLDRGMIRDAGEQPSEEGPPRRTFAITELGRDLVEREAERLRRSADAAAELLARSPAAAGD